MAKYRVLKTLPKGQQPGDSVELNDDEARVFLAVGAIEAPTSADPTKPKTRRGSREYQRRDLEAED